MDRQQLKEAILEELRRRPVGLFELSIELDESPTLVLEALQELESEEKVGPRPLWDSTYWRME